MSKELDDLKAAVAKNTTVVGSAATLISRLAQQIKDAANSGDLATVEELATSLNANSDALAAAVTTNTPSAGEGAQSGSGDQSGTAGEGTSGTTAA